MMKLINRLLILAVIAFGIWFIVRHWDSVEVPVVETPEEIIIETEEPTNENSEGENDVSLRFEEETKKLTITLPEETTPVVLGQPVIQKVTPVVTPPVVTVPVDTNPINAVLADSVLRVYLYDGGFDISSSSIQAGHVTFIVRNDGRLSHEFSVKGMNDFGRVKPGTSAVFESTLSSGEYVLYSPRTVDQSLNMQETLRVESN